MPSTASPVVTVGEVLMLSKGKSPVRINQRPSKSIPRFLPAKLFVNVMLFSLWMLADARNEVAYIISQGRLICFANRPPRYVREMSAIGSSSGAPNELDQLREAYRSLNGTAKLH